MRTAADSQRWLDPGVLMGLGNIELIARAAVEGLVAGLHRSPRFGFSQEFAEYRPYTDGDDPRFVDWNVYARTDRTYVKRYLGETNTRLMILLDVSPSMGFGGDGLNKLRYAKYLAASLAYLATRQHDATGLIAFDHRVREYLSASSRRDRLRGLLHAIDRVTPSNEEMAGTDLSLPFDRFREQAGQRGLVAVISDYFCDVSTMVSAVMPLALQGHDVVFFQVLHPEEMHPRLSESATLEDMESRQCLEISPRYLSQEYPQRLAEHLETLRSVISRSGADYYLMQTDQRLDGPLRRYLKFRQRRC